MKQEAVIFKQVAAMLQALNLNIVQEDTTRPWGGFYVIDELQAGAFAQAFFPEADLEDLKIGGKLSPKILMVAPHKRLSWQYHHRRAEIWCCIEGEVAVATSDTDEEVQRLVLQPGDQVRLGQGERHRLIGTHTWGVVAEIWQHTDAAHPSDEDDIVRLQDDFGR
jgi:mannose-6-phosphate isomerase